MPRNDQITRQWHLLRCLEDAQARSLSSLIDAIPEDFPKNSRTVRRDLEALAAAGYPLITERVRGQTRWRLMEGFCNPPALGFAPTELMALNLSRHLLTPLEGTEIHGALTSALNKVAAALSPQARDYVRAMEDIFSVGLGPHKKYSEHRKTIVLISQAIDKGRTAQMRYYSASRQGATRREIDPYFLRFAGGGLYLIGHCHLRKGVRIFAVERIRSMTLTDRPYQIPLDFKVDEYVQDALGIMRSGRRIDVELSFTKRAAAWMKDKQWHPSQEMAVLNDGRLAGF